ncbi:MAG TPA: PQQ-dependent sugar dehydrogenase [Planctomycetaceae bacterium]|nr:PQQ-dependent sugar dehydrogenase [Planctomycetaceae bacterium]
MRNISCLMFSTLLLAGSMRFADAQTPENALTDAEARSGWKLLFDGKSAKNFRNYKKDTLSDGWAVEDGAIVRKQGGAGDIITKQQYGSFDLQLEYKISKAGNSGLMFHVTEDNPAPWHSGPEVQIQDNVDGHDPQKSGWLYQLYQPRKPAWVTQAESQVGVKTPDTEDATRPAGEWNHLYLRVTPQEGEVCLNGVSYFKFQVGSKDWNERVAKSKFAKMEGFGKAGKGHICLQDHGNLVSFRNIKIRELPPDGPAPNPIDGQLAGVKTVEAFPKLEWEGWEPIDERGKPQTIRPLDLMSSHDGTNRLFVMSQSGMIHTFVNDPNATKAKMFLDIRARVHDWQKDNEEGLLGLALHPEFEKNGRLFVYYTAEEKPHTSYVSQFTVSRDDPDKADPNSEKIVMEIPQPFANHNGGSIAFGPDGYLYIGLGDGGSRNDPMANGQNLETWMGSVLRIDVDGKQNGKNYGIPSDNPFVSQTGAKPEIYAYGFRNLWRIDFDPKTGTLWGGEVGQDLWEEIHIIEKGGNYGWSVREGTHLFGNKSSDGPFIAPVWEYDHQVGKSITGGCVYRGKAVPELDGAYLYGDYVSGRLWALDYDVDAGKIVSNQQVAWNNLPISGFGQDDAGEVYIMIPSPNGKAIFKLVKE